MTTGNDSNPVGVTVNVVARGDTDLATASKLSQQLSLPFGGLEKSANADKSLAWQLLVAANQRILVRPDGARLSVDFNHGKVVARLNQAAKDQSLLRALGLTRLNQSQRQRLKLIDATAGLGQDSWLIANQGCTVTLLEESHLFAYLLEHALSQAALQPKLRPIVNNMSVVSVTAQDHLASLNNHSWPDIVYLDPMFPERKKQAKVKKGMQFLHALLPQIDNTDLLECALAVALNRVVVKRPASAEPLHGSENWRGQITQVKTDAMRFDVYHTQTKT
jgi:16S rRNA (guanine1516-N2)-methyltransferase